MSEQPPSRATLRGATLRPRLPASPCVGVCIVDESAGYCAGCGRTPADIAIWPHAGRSKKHDIWRVLPQRLAELDVTSFRLPAEPEEIARFVRLSNSERAGSWHMAGGDTHVSFEPTSGATITWSDHRVEVRNANGGHFQFECHDRVRAFGLTLEPGQSELRAVALVLPRGRAEINHDSPLEDANDKAWETEFSVCTTAGPYARVYRNQKLTAHRDFSAESQVPPDTLRIETALGHITTHSNEQPKALSGILPSSDDTSVIPNSFVACAVFLAFEATWLSGQLAP